MQPKNELHWIISKTKEETPNVISLFLKAEESKKLFIAGQYLTIKLLGLGPVEGKAYSISSAPHEDELRITIKKIGSFSSHLHKLKIGDTIVTSQPYGFFYPEPDERSDLVFVVGGIGITPCISIIKDLTYKKSSRPIHLFYSNQTEKDILFAEELSELKKINPNLHINNFITRETPKTTTYKAGRITPNQIINSVPKYNTSEFFLCGSMDFTKSFWKGLKDEGVDVHQIYTEGFF